MIVELRLARATRPAYHYQVHSQIWFNVVNVISRLALRLKLQPPQTNYLREHLSQTPQELLDSASNIQQERFSMCTSRGWILEIVCTS